MVTSIVVGFAILYAVFFVTVICFACGASLVEDYLDMYQRKDYSGMVGNTLFWIALCILCFVIGKSCLS